MKKNHIFRLALSFEVAYSCDESVVCVCVCHLLSELSWLTEGRSCVRLESVVEL